MLDDAFFRDRIDAQLEYVATRSAGEAIPVLRRRLEDGTWERHAAGWITALGAVERRDLSDAEEVHLLRTALVNCLCEGGVGEAAHAVIPTLVASSADGSEVRTLIAWFVKAAGPGDAALGARVALGMLKDERAELFRDASDALVAWLLETGAAELRGKRWGELLARSAVRAFESGQLATAERVLRFLIASEGGITMQAIAFGGNDHGPLLRLLDAVAAHQSRIVLRIVDRLDVGLDELIVARAIDQRYPNLRAAVVSGLLAGEIHGALAGAIWTEVFAKADPPPNVRFRNRRDSLVAAQVLGGWVVLSQRHLRTDDGSPLAARVAGWTTLIATEVVRLTALLDAGCGDEEARRILQSLDVQWSPAARGLHDALLLAARQTSGAVAADVVRLLEDGGALSSRAALLMVAAGATERAGAVVPEPAWDVVEQFVNTPWVEPIAGVDVAGLLRGVRNVRGAPLTDDDKLKIAGDTIVVDAVELANAIKPTAAPEDQRAVAALYFAHELVHLQQDIGDKRQVIALRARGAETAVMHLDLAADHAAAQLVNHAFPRWSLAHLKNLQGLGLAAFPASRLNTKSARARKAVRLVSLRLDWLVRGDARASEGIGEGYVYADYGPGEGPIFAFTSGPPVALLLPLGALDSEAASTLDRAADDDVPCVDVDAALRGAFALQSSRTASE